ISNAQIRHAAHALPFSWLHALAPPLSPGSPGEGKDTPLIAQLLALQILQALALGVRPRGGFQGLWGLFALAHQVALHNALRVPALTHLALPPDPHAALATAAAGAAHSHLSLSWQQFSQIALPDRQQGPRPPLDNP
ncbi:hypothetical protein, partial [Paracidovorax wautersii]